MKNAMSDPLTIAPICMPGFAASVPAVSAWTVDPSATSALVRCTPCHSRRGRWRIRSDVPSMARRNQKATMPNATGPGRHVAAIGTRTSFAPKWT
jgi:hypothetical protein